MLNGHLIPDEITGVNKKYVNKKNRPRIESAFVRIERVTVKATGYHYWKVTTKENTVTFFGRTAASRIANPTNPTTICEWLPDMSFDDKGNLMVFEYKKEDGDIGSVTLNDRNRFDEKGNILFAQQYVIRIR